MASDAETTLGERLRRAREAKGLGSTELAGKVGASHGLVSEIERGKTTELKAANAIHLARALDVSVEWLVLGEGEGPRPPKPPRARTSPKPAPSPKRGRAK